MDKKYNILICPLEWGLGHSGRMIPLVRKLQEKQNNVFIGSGAIHQAFFRSELQGLTFIDFPGFNPGYSRYLPQYIYILLKTPYFLCQIAAEHFRLKRIIRDHKIDIVISDNRAGLWNRRVKTVYITHQPLIPLPDNLRFLEWIGILAHRFFIMKYSFCFIPDLPGEINLTGRLTHGLKLPENSRFIGILSRFAAVNDPLPHTSGSANIALILSGPEPQRTILGNKITEIFRQRKLPAVILEGRPENSMIVSKSDNITSHSHLPAGEMQKLITGSKSIVSRSGYTTIMELVSLNRTALLIPTPGQTEQEYLARYLSGKGWFSSIPQKKIDGSVIFPSGEAEFPAVLVEESKGLLEKALDELLNQENKHAYSQGPG